MGIIQLPPDGPDRQPAGEYHGFISYRRDGGADVAIAVRAHLQMRRLNTFLDVDELATGPFGPHLLRAIEQSPSFLLILSPKSLDRVQEPGDWLRAEIAHAIRTRRTIIPIVMDGFHFPDATALPTEIRRGTGSQRRHALAGVLRCRHRPHREVHARRGGLSDGERSHGPSAASNSDRGTVDIFR